MASEQIRMDRPLSRLELAVVTMLIAACFTWFLNRMNEMTALAEAGALDLTIRSLRTGVTSRVAAGLIGGDPHALVDLANDNPVGSAIEPPGGYIGAVRDAEPASIQPGQWYFDEDQRWLVYHVVNTDYFMHQGEGAARVRIQLKLIYNDLDGNGAFDPGVEQATGVSVIILDPLEWRF